MELNRIIFLFFNIIMAVALLGIIIHVYRPSKRREMEEPKYRMLKDD